MNRGNRLDICNNVREEAIDDVDTDKFSHLSTPRRKAGGVLGYFSQDDIELIVRFNGECVSFGPGGERKNDLFGCFRWEMLDC